MTKGISVGLAKGHEVTTRILAPRHGSRKGRCGKRVGMIRDLIREVAGSAPYEKRLVELLKNGRDKRALKLAKRKLGTHLRGKKKREEMGNLMRKSSRKATAEGK
ncbi:ribosomal protein L36e [Ostreococcus tauri]|uniref:60S ribosomal protein L36 n=1 Tax=Ostreococcus tauri TaxID=70448 RepID=A0A1Y5HZC5_OSTTA|nr:ribosomal protein L36e [Ostreococcus tauri]